MCFKMKTLLALLLTSSVYLHAEDEVFDVRVNEPSVDETKFQVSAMTFTLKQKVNNPSYPNEAQLSELFKTKVIEELTAKNLYAENGIALSVDGQTTRMFIGEAFGMAKSLGTSNCS